MTTTRRRTLSAIAALLAIGALAVPLWGFSMSAPQYPDETLRLRVTRGGITGDVHEIETLQQYIGVRFPTDLPELTWAIRGIVALAAVLALGGVVGGGRFGRVYRAGCAVAIVAFVAASGAAVQARLYRVGHERDPHAPIRAIGDFTPPLVGPVQVGNFTVWSYPHFGALFLLAASVMSIAALRKHTARGGPVDSTLILRQAQDERRVKGPRTNGKQDAA